MELPDKTSGDISVIIGVEISHVPPEKIGKLVKKARDSGAGIAKGNDVYLEIRLVQGRGIA
ncbi:MAG: hypothetical protein U9O85_00455 [Euryarchaeota archaeon]|nr:hypothetical protein [Euryarchaeota archaeon]